jgi:hypothetical protein
MLKLLGIIALESTGIGAICLNVDVGLLHVNLGGHALHGRQLWAIGVDTHVANG